MTSCAVFISRRFFFVFSSFFLLVGGGGNGSVLPIYTVHSAGGAITKCARHPAVFSVSCPKDLKHFNKNSFVSHTVFAVEMCPVACDFL
jgi:hypothetical protein